MNALGRPASKPGSRLAKPPGVQPLFVADWLNALFLHYEVAPRELQPFIPFELDLWNGRAFISLVAFTMHGMRFSRFGALGARLCKPIATHEFLNLRTYVRCGDEKGICFLSEWLPNRLSVLLGPLLYSLPYRHATIRYARNASRLHGSIATQNGSYRYEGNLDDDLFTECVQGSLDHFLLERYTAFNADPARLQSLRGRRRFFKVWHEAWLQIRAAATVLDDSLLHDAVPWWPHTNYCGANFSPGVRSVQMSAPRRV